MKILILKPSSLGDIIHALPVLRLLKRHHPASQIYWWVDSGLRPLLEGDPDLAGTIPFERKRWRSPVHWPEMLSSIREMRSHRFDLAIDLQGLARSGIFAWLTDAKLTVGLDNAREGSQEGARAFYDLTPTRAAPDVHAVDRYLAVLPLLGVPVHSSFEWLPRRAEIANAVDQKWQPGVGPWIVLLPGARWENKRWPVENFAALVQKMRHLGNLQFVILGSEDERERAAAIANALPERVLNLAGKTTLWEMIEWIRRGKLVVTNDTGPMHIAAAVNRPLLAIFGPTDPRKTGPYGKLTRVLQTHSLPCIPCLKPTCSYAAPLACLTRLTPDIVFTRVKEELENSSSLLGSVKKN